MSAKFVLCSDFCLPSSDITQEEKFAYIELFMLFTEPEPHSKLYQIACSHVHMQWHVVIIPLSCIFCSCHLLPACRGPLNPEWTPETVLELCEDFFLNSFCDHHMYLFV